MKILNKIALPALLALALSSCGGAYTPPDHQAGSPADMFPDYSGVTVPPNLAPLNFRILNPADEFQAAVWAPGSDSPQIVVTSSDGLMEIPLDEWRALLSAHKGDSLTITTATRDGSGWTGYTPMTLYVSPDTIDGYLAYRLLYPGYELWNEMGIYQRDLSTYTQTPIMENKDVDKMCMNCHSFSAGDPNTMMMHVRGKDGGTLIHTDGRTRKVNPSPEGMAHGATYPAWSPKGRFIAFSANDVRQFFHRSGTKTIEVSDMAADLMVYDTQDNRAFTDSAICGDRYIETFPTWAPDGETIYFCRAEQAAGAAIDSVRYDLCRVSFDPSTGKFGQVEKIYDARAEGKSVSFPRVSPDGRWLMITRSDYGNFSIWHPESSLCIIDLTDMSLREMDEVNAPGAVDSYHSWSSNGKWFVFSSKRIDGLWARPFIAAFDPATGRAGSPILLPQLDPDIYKEMLQTFNVPELVRGHVDFSADLLDAVHTPPSRAVMN